MAGAKKKTKGKRRGVPPGRAATRKVERARIADIEACAKRLGDLLVLDRASYWDRVSALALGNSSHIPDSLKSEGEERGVPAFALRDAIRGGDLDRMTKFWKIISANDAVRFRRFVEKEDKKDGPLWQAGEIEFEAVERLRAQEAAYQNRDMTPPINEEEIAGSIDLLAALDWQDSTRWPNVEWVRRYFGISRKVLMRVSKRGRWGSRDVGTTFRESPKRRGRPLAVLSPAAMVKVLRHVAVEWPGVAESALELAEKLQGSKK